MSNKSIVYIGGFDLPDNNAAAQRVVSNAKAFREIGYNTFFIGLSKNNIGNLENLQCVDGFIYVNTAYPKSPSQWYAHLISIKKYTPYLRSKKPDLVIAYNMPALALNNLRRWAKKTQINLVADCTEWYVPSGFVVSRLLKALDTVLRMRYVHVKLNGVITISSFLFNYYHTRMNNVIQVPPLVDLELEKWKPTGFDLQSNGTVNFIYAGSPGTGSKDRLDTIVQLLSEIKVEGYSNFVFTIIGISKEQFEMYFNTYLPENIKENIVFRGRLTHLESLQEIKKAHFNLFIRESNLINTAGFPTKLAESISCGTPVITNSTSNIGDFIQNGVNGFLIDSISEKSIKEAVIAAINLPIEKIQNMKFECLNSRMFDYLKYTSQFQSLINNLKLECL